MNAYTNNEDFLVNYKLWLEDLRVGDEVVAVNVMLKKYSEPMKIDRLTPKTIITEQFKFCCNTGLLIRGVNSLDDSLQIFPVGFDSSPLRKRRILLDNLSRKTVFNELSDDQLDVLWRMIKVMNPEAQGIFGEV